MMFAGPFHLVDNGHTVSLMASRVSARGAALFNPPRPGGDVPGVTTRLSAVVPPSTRTQRCCATDRLASDRF